jgi:SAM-dependent methyltransferase
MLAVAARVEPDVEWHRGDAADLPFPDERFDAALCQMAFMFFPDPDEAIGEMHRVVRPAGAVAALVPASLDVQPAYRVFVDIAERHAGPEARSLLGAYWSCGDLDLFAARFEGAGLDVTERITRSSPARFDDVGDFVRTEVEGSPLVERVDGDTIGRICRDAAAEMAQWRTDEGFEIPLVCHIVTARRPPR